MTYFAPIAEQQFVLKEVANLPSSRGMPRLRTPSPDVVSAVLEESGRLAGEVFAPLNATGDRHGARWSEDGVTLPPGFADAYRAYVEGGWGSLTADPAHGGQGLPFVLGCAVQEQIASANMAFSLCMMLTQGAVEALSAHANDDVKAVWLPKLVSGEWAGTMALTEPQAGSDLGAVRTRAERDDEGGYRISGTKIFITWGEHDLAANIVHLVLARLPDAPAGAKGLSLFLVPKVRSNGTPNDVRCTGIEEKLGIHASPTCTLVFGDAGRCSGILIGEKHGGLKAMFTMMNHARVHVGIQGVAIAERACQAALAYARERVQAGVPIIHHPDVRRMLMRMQALTQGARALAYYAAGAIDQAHGGEDEASRRYHRGLADLLTPVVKAWCTEVGVEVASLGIQVLGGAGYIEETGVAQHLRDARIAPIYEGTNGIQAMDLVRRKLPQEFDASYRTLIAEMARSCEQLAVADGLTELHDPLSRAIATLEVASETVVRAAPADAAAAAAPYLQMFGLVTSAWLLSRQAVTAAETLAVGAGDRPFHQAKIGNASFFITQILPQAEALAPAIQAKEEALIGWESSWEC